LTDLGFAGPGVPGRRLYAGQCSIDDIRAATGRLDGPIDARGNRADARKRPAGSLNPTWR
jgi:hypothetical protein